MNVRDTDAIREDWLKEGAVGSPIHDRGPVMQLHSGRAFYPLDPRPSDIRVSDIAHALSLQCRYSGHCRTFYSVAQHSVLVSRQMPEGGELEGLFHDAHEAFIGDITRPMKHVLGDIVRAVTDRIDRAIESRYGLEFARWRDDIKEIDNCVLAAERRDLMADCVGGWDWGPMPEPYERPIVACGPAVAYAMFIERFLELQGLRG